MRGSVKAGAIVNWCGISDVADLIDGPNKQDYAVSWIGIRPDSVALAKSMSPLHYIRRGVPPVVTIHGDLDQCVSYSHAVRLQGALVEAGVPNRHVTIHGGGHGEFDVDTTLDICTRIFDCLLSVGVPLDPGI